jgi:hypothetical protein
MIDYFHEVAPARAYAIHDAISRRGSNSLAGVVR